MISFVRKIIKLVILCLGYAYSLNVITNAYYTMQSSMELVLIFLKSPSLIFNTNVKYLNNDKLTSYVNHHISGSVFGHSKPIWVPFDWQVFCVNGGSFRFEGYHQHFVWYPSLVRYNHVCLHILDE